MDRLLIFGDNHLSFPPLLIREVHRLLKGRSDIELCGVVDASRLVAPCRLSRNVKGLATRLAKSLFNPTRIRRFWSAPRENLSDVCRKLHLPIFTPSNRDINDPDFIIFLRNEIRPTLGLAAGCLQIFRKDCMDLFDVLVNYHNGLLPDYGGLYATRWSIYQNENATGFTYHRISDVCDGGPILHRDSIALNEKTPPEKIECLKTQRAEAALEEVVNRMIARDPGMAQPRRPRCFSRKAFDDITTLSDPERLTASEIEKRLSAFDCLHIRIKGVYYPVTTLKRVGGLSGKKSRLVFSTRDSVEMLPVRFQYLPLSLFRLCRTLPVLPRHPDGRPYSAGPQT